MFLPSGRVHALGAGLVIFEIQQNSDTTYRVFDWNRRGLDGKPRELHIAQSLASIDFNDFEPRLIKSKYSRNAVLKVRYLVDDPLFRVDACLVKRGERFHLRSDAVQILGVPERPPGGGRRRIRGAARSRAVRAGARVPGARHAQRGNTGRISPRPGPLNRLTMAACASAQIAACYRSVTCQAVTVAVSKACPRIERIFAALDDQHARGVRGGEDRALGSSYDTFATLLVTAFLLGVLNAFLRPLLILLALPLVIVTFGLFLFVINALLLYLVGKLVKGFHGGRLLGRRFWGAVVITFVTLLLNSITGSGRARLPVHRGTRPPQPPDDDDGPVIDV